MAKLRDAAANMAAAVAAERTVEAKAIALLNQTKAMLALIATRPTPEDVSFIMHSLDNYIPQPQITPVVNPGAGGSATAEMTPAIDTSVPIAKRLKKRKP